MAGPTECASEAAQKQFAAEGFLVVRNLIDRVSNVNSSVLARVCVVYSGYVPYATVLEGAAGMYL